MELLYLLCSILSTFLTSLTLSLLLPLRTLLRRLSPSRAASPSSSSSVSLYQGTVFHERRRPVHHSFRYSVRYALIDLDDAPHALPNHLSADEARRIAGTSGRTLLLTIPESVGYEQNPLSLYYCYDDQILKQCIAEDMFGNWSIRANAPDNTLFVSISVQHPDLGNYFTATLKAKRVPSSLVSDHALFFWLMPHKVAVWIYWHAFKLWWKNVAFVQHPRYTNPAYREEALVRNQKLQCCPAIGLDKDKHLRLEGSSQGCRVNKESEVRYIKWRDAKWPWY
ncbi:hypothetical protein ABKV19_006201 [Rosa sericea]